MARTYQDFLRQMFELIDNGMIQFPQLAHGLTALLYDMRRNDFSRYLQAHATLLREIDELKASKPQSESHERYVVGYLRHLNLAKTVIEFWYDIFVLFHDKEPKSHVYKRILPNGRKLVEFGTISCTKRSEPRKHNQVCKRTKNGR